MIRHALTAPVAALLATMLATVVGQSALAQTSPPFVESAPAVESVPQYMRQLAGRDLDDLLLADGIAAQSGWVGGKYAFYLTYRGPERMPDWLALSLANTAEQKAPLRVAALVAALLGVGDRAAFLRDYDDRLGAAGPWRLCLARAGHQVLIHNRGSATFVSFAQRELSADITCTQLGG
jgi:hypothetical protein